MGNSHFQFKQFSIQQDRCAMKMSTDAVLLGALAHQDNAALILDVGAGTGVIGLMLAQRFPGARVHGVEIDEQAHIQAAQNFQASPWKDRLEGYHAAFQDYVQSHAKTKYDLIVSNPPYFSNQLKSPNVRRNLARHDDQLSLKDLLQGVKQLLSEEGLFWLILPLKEMNLFKNMAVGADFSLRHEYQVFDQPGVYPHREICSFGRGEFFERVSAEILLKDASGEAGRTYSDLVKDFLLHF